MWLESQTFPEYSADSWHFRCDSLSDLLSTQNYEWTLHFLSQHRTLEWKVSSSKDPFLSCECFLPRGLWTWDSSFVFTEDLHQYIHICIQTQPTLLKHVYSTEQNLLDAVTDRKSRASDSSKLTISITSFSPEYIKIKIPIKKLI